MGDEGGKSRYFVLPKASRRDRDAGVPGARPVQNDHVAVKSLTLMRHLVRLVARRGSLRHGKTVALKILSGRYGSAEADRLRADVELLAAAAVGRDPHVVAVRGGGLAPVPHLVMEYVAGESLAARLGGSATSRCPRPFRWAGRLLRHWSR
jgi:hypothetical protein